MKPMSASSPHKDEFDRGLELFNCGHYFEAHEVLEDVWRGISRELPFRRHVQGMVQLAVAFHHQSRSNCVGARSVLDRALRNLNGSDLFFHELDLARLRADLEPWRHYLRDCARTSMSVVAPALPIIRLKDRRKNRRRKTTERR